MYAKTEDYLIAVSGKVRLAVSCNDVRNVYRQRIKVVPITQQEDFYLGITCIADQVMPLIDLRRRLRIGNTQPTASGDLNVITFQTGMDNRFAVVVDEILGMKGVPLNTIRKANSDLHNNFRNLNLLLPQVAILDDGTIIHILDTTYLDKTKPISEGSGEMEFLF